MFFDELQVYFTLICVFFGCMMANSLIYRVLMPKRVNRRFQKNIAKSTKIC